MSFTNLLLPLILLGVALYATGKQCDVYAAFLKGASDGILIMGKILPSLIVFLPALWMLRASGGLDALALFLAPLLNFFKIPSELLPLMLIRPFSGSAALSIGAEILETYGPDSLIGQIASVMLGSTETTFYTVALYFGSCGITKTRYAIPAALCADFTGFILASLTVRLFLQS